MRASSSLVLSIFALSAGCSSALARDSDFYDPFAGSGRLRLGFANQLNVTVGTVSPHVRVQSDGSILIAGSENGGPGINKAFHVLRLAADGSADSGFGSSGEKVFDFDIIAMGSDQVEDLAVQSDGSVLLTGGAEGPSATTGNDCALARLTSVGQLDLSFSGDGKLTFGFNAGPSGFQNDECTSLLVQQDQQIVVGGIASANASGNNTMALARFNTDGTPDNSFSSSGLSNKRVLDLTPLIGASALTKVVELSTHKLLAIGVGAISSGGGSEDVWALVRLNTDGSLDTNYGFNGVQIYAFQPGGNDIDLPYDAIVLADDSVVVVGQTQVQGNPLAQVAIAKFSPSGSLDTSWGNNGRQVISFGLGGAFGDQARGIAMDSQGRFIVAGAGDVGGSPDNEDMLVVRLLANGTFDSNFGVQGKRDVQLSVAPTPDYFEGALGVAVAPDDSIIMVGVADPDGLGNSEVLGVAKLIGDTVFSSGFGG
jgi:uncharacterized delta-60 repeat protein